MKAVGNGHQLPAHANVRDELGEYIVELDVADFTEQELTVEVVGWTITVRGDQLGNPGDAGRAFLLHERLEESFRLPDDADPDHTRVYFNHGTLELHTPRVRDLEPRLLTIERSPGLVNPHAEPV
jgi:HSP20 family molecular chaperone IbpA